FTPVKVWLKCGWNASEIYLCVIDTSSAIKQSKKSLSNPNIKKWLNGPIFKSAYLLMSVEIEMMNIIILEGIESDFGIALQPELIKSIIRALMGNRRARRSRTGTQYFNEFRTHFWERPEDEFDRIRNINSSNRRRNRDVGNTTLAPPIEEVEHALSMRSSVRQLNQSPSIISRRSQRHSPYPILPHDNTNMNNPVSEQNISTLPPPIETLSPQPPPYSRVTDEAQNNNQSQDSSNHEVAVSGSNLTPDLLNLSLSRNDSDISMPDIG
ncbi:26749_t:CDS:2, partial [Gigaspora margarita]